MSFPKWIVESKSLRPWVKIEIPVGGWKIHYPAKYYNFFKSMEFSMVQGPAEVKFELFDQEGRQAEIAKCYQTMQDALERDRTAPNERWIQFQWGITRDDGQEKTSKIHFLLMNRFDMKYVEGGIRYIIEGHDVFALAEDACQETRALLTSQAAINARLTNDKHGTVPLKAARFDVALKDILEHYNDMGRSKNISVEDILNEVCTVNGKSPASYFDSIETQYVVDEERDPPPKAGEIFGPHYIDHYDKGEPSAVLSFDVKIDMMNMTMAYANVPVTENKKRVMHDNKENAHAVGGGKESPHDSPTVYNGSPAVRPPHKQESTLDVPTSKENLELRVEQSVAGKSTGASYMINASLTIHGWPPADVHQNLILRFIELKVYKPYYVDGKEWKGHEIDPVLTGKWMIRKLQHIIDDGGYRINMDLTRIGQNVDKKEIAFP